MKTAHVLMWPLAIPLILLSGCETTQKQGFGSVAQSYAGGLVAMFSESEAEKREQEEMDQLIEEGRQRHEREKMAAQAQRERERQEALARAERQEAERRAEWERQEAEQRAEQERREAAVRVEREQRDAAQRKAEAEQRAVAEREEAEARERAREALNARKARSDYQPFPLDNADAAAAWAAGRQGGLLQDHASGNPLRLEQNSWVHALEVEDLVGQRVTYVLEPMAPSGSQSEIISREGVWVGFERAVDTGGRVLGNFPIYSGIQILPQVFAFGREIPSELAAELDRNSKILVSGRIASAGYGGDEMIELKIMARTGGRRIGGVSILQVRLEDIRVEKVPL